MAGEIPNPGDQVKKDDIPFPTGSEVGAQDKYFFRYHDEAARLIAEGNGLDPNNEKTVAKIAIHLNQTYTKTPEIALADIHDVLSDPTSAKRMSVYTKYDDDWKSEFPPDDDGSDYEESGVDSEY